MPGQEGRLRKETRPVTPQHIAEQLDELRKFSTTKVPATTGRKPECYLSWLDLESGQRAIDLGPYARWLIAADLLAGRRPEERLEQLFGDDPDLGKHASKVNLVFALTAEKSRTPTTAQMYARVTDDRRGDLDIVFRTIIRRLNQRFAQDRGAPLARADFLQLPVSISGKAPIVGEEPIQSFRQWIEWGVGTPLPADLHEKPIRPRGGRAGARMPGRILSAAKAAIEGRCTENIVSVAVGESGPMPLSGYETSVRRQLGTSAGAPIHVVSLDLSSGATPHSVVRTLYQKLRLDDSRLENFERRAVDLNTDLDPVRRSLAVNRVLVLVEGWDNIGGTFSALHEYLRYADWGEFLRVLAQPHAPIWRASGGTPGLRSALLIFSTRPPAELGPWARFLDPKEFASHASVPPAAGVSAHRARLAYRAYNLAAIRRWENDLEKNKRGTRRHTAALDSLIVGAALKLIACSISGLRRDTLHRCLNRWLRLFYGDARLPQVNRTTAFTRHIKWIAKDFQDLIQEVPDDELENLPSHLRSVELNIEPRIYAKPRTTGGPSSVLTFASLDTRSGFVSAWLKELSTSDVGSVEYPQSWPCIHFVLAEEALTQANSQFRHMEGDRIGTPYAMRRICQTVFHGLQSLDANEDGFHPDASNSSGLFGPMLPADPGKRYRHLYVFLLRRVAEGGAWRLMRAFARAELCLDLLTLFLMPKLGYALLTGESPQARNLPCKDFHAEEDIAPWLLADPRMWFDLLRAMGAAGYDLGGKRGDAAVAWVLHRLPGGKGVRKDLPRNAADAALLELAGQSALTLRIDFEQMKGASASAEEACWNKLHDLRIQSTAIRQLQRGAAAVFDLLSKAATSDVMRRGLGQVLDPALDAVRKQLSTVRPQPERQRNLAQYGALSDYELASALLYRLADIVSQQKPPSPQPRSALLQVAYGCMVFWIADRLRSDVGDDPANGLIWARAEAPAIRAYIRVCLRLAEMLTELPETANEVAVRRMANRFLVHAQMRLGVFVRHHFEYRREQVSMLILEAHRIRVWVRVRIARHRTDKSATETTLNNEARLLGVAWELLEEAEGHLLSLGYQLSHVPRMWSERLLTALTVVELAAEFRRIGVAHELRDQVDAHLALAIRLHDLLEHHGKRSASTYWQTLVKGLRQRIDSVRTRWASS